MDIGALIVITGSMEPTINIKELIIIKEQKYYCIGDIITYRDYNNNLVTHRIVKISENEIITRGDNNTVSDRPINIKRIEGKVVYHSIVIGEIFLYWVKPILYFIFVCLVFNIIKSEISRRKKHEEKIKNNPNN